MLVELLLVVILLELFVHLLGSYELFALEVELFEVEAVLFEGDILGGFWLQL